MGVRDKAAMADYTAGLIENTASHLGRILAEEGESLVNVVPDPKSAPKSVPGQMLLAIAQERARGNETEDVLVEAAKRRARMLWRHSSQGRMAAAKNKGVWPDPPDDFTSLPDYALRAYIRMLRTQYPLE